MKRNGIRPNIFLGCDDAIFTWHTASTSTMYPTVDNTSTIYHLVYTDIYKTRPILPLMYHFRHSQLLFIHAPTPFATMYPHGAMNLPLLYRFISLPNGARWYGSPQNVDAGWFVVVCERWKRLFSQRQTVTHSIASWKFCDTVASASNRKREHWHSNCVVVLDLNKFWYI